MNIINFLLSGQDDFVWCPQGSHVVMQNDFDPGADMCGACISETMAEAEITLHAGVWSPRRKSTKLMTKRINSLGLCGRCGFRIVAPPKEEIHFFELMDTLDGRKEKLCVLCGTSFGLWWRQGKSAATKSKNK